MPAEILDAHNIGEVRPGFKASFIVWSGAPFSLTSHAIKVGAEGKVVYEE